MNPDSQEAIQHRKDFYTSSNVDTLLKKSGVPKSKSALQELVAIGLGKNLEEIDGDALQTYGHVYFQVHPQQINIRDKANGKLIVSIRK